MRRKIFALAAMILTLVFSAAALAAIPGINNSRYIKMYVLSSGNDTPVYTDAHLFQRGTSSPYRAYNATIYANDEIWVFAMNDRYALISYPTSSGRRQGYVRTSALTGNNYSQSVRKARRQLTEIYARPGVRYSGSSISNGDDVWTVARQENYTQVVYPTGSTYKMAWITNSDYDNYIASQSGGGSSGTNLKGDVNNDGRVDREDVNLMRQYMIEAVGDSAINKNNADLNNDGEVGISDYSMLMDMINRPPSNVNHNPQGSVTSADSPAPYTLHVKGTVFDEDNPNASVRVHVYVGGTPGSSVPQYEIRTNGSNRVFEDTRTIDRNYAGRQLVHVYALNDHGSGNNVEIWKGYVDIQGQATSNNELPGGLLYPMKGSISVSSSRTLSNGINCDYVALQGDKTEIRAPYDGYVEFRQVYSTKHNALISYANHIVFTTTIGNDSYEIKLCHLSKFVGAPDDSRLISRTLTRPLGCGESDFDRDGEQYKKYKKTIILGNRKVRVSKNQLIGYAGQTGNANGVHVHMEVRKNGGSPLNPKSVFTTW